MKFSDGSLALGGSRAAHATPDTLDTRSRFSGSESEEQSRSQSLYRGFVFKLLPWKPRALFSGALHSVALSNLGDGVCIFGGVRVRDRRAECQGLDDFFAF